VASDSLLDLKIHSITHHEIEYLNLTTYATVGKLKLSTMKITNEGTNASGHVTGRQ